MSAACPIDAILLFESLCLIMTTMVLDVWNQATRFAETSLNKEMDWVGPKQMLLLQAAARMIVAVRPLLDEGLAQAWFGNLVLQNWSSRAWLYVGMSLIGLSSFLCFRLLARALPPRLQRTALGNVLVASGGIAAFLQAFWLGKDIVGMADLVAGLCFALYGCALLTLSLKYRQRRVALFGGILIAVGCITWIGGLTGQPLISMITLSAGSFASQLHVHARLIEISGNRASGASPGLGAINWIMSSASFWVFTAMGQGLGPVSSKTLELAGVFIATMLAMHHFGEFQMSIIHYIKRLGYDRTQCLLNGISAAAFLTNVDGKIEAFSASASNVTDKGHSEILGKEIHQLFPVDKSWPKHAWERFECREELQDPARILLFEQKKLPTEAFLGSVVTVTDVTTEREALAELDRLSRTDALTGLPNRREALLRLNGYISSGADSFALAFADLDHFKNANSIEGHDYGDALLKDISRMFQRTCDTMGCWVARFGGDEFLLCFPAGSGEKEIGDLWERLAGEIENSEARRRYSVGLSLGAAVYPRDGETPEILIKHADTALFKAKTGGRGRLEIFGHDLEQEIVTKVAIERALRRCLREGRGFNIHIQPIVRIADFSLAGGECVLRFNEQRLIGTSIQRIIATAESSGQIIPLGYLVLQQCLGIADRLESYGLNLQVAVNLSASQFNDEATWDLLDEWARERGGAAGRVKIEVTETAVAKDIGKAKLLLERARRDGYRISLDDFGTGYSSLSTLRQLPFTEMKLDKSLLDDVTRSAQARRIVEATLAFAEVLNVEVVAEGVEHREQAQWLRDEGRCRYGQGFYWARPMPWEDFVEEARSGRTFGQARAANQQSASGDAEATDSPDKNELHSLPGLA